MFNKFLVIEDFSICIKSISRGDIIEVASTEFYVKGFGYCYEIYKNNIFECTVLRKDFNNQIINKLKVI